MLKFRNILGSSSFRRMFSSLLENNWFQEPLLLNKNDLSNPSLYLQDAFGRQHTYLRISLTERCNLRCQYCMPEDGISLSPKDHLLTTDEILYLASLFAKQGVTKIRLTGGEPTVNKDIINIIRRIHELPGIETIGMTTNGLVLNRILPDLQKAGLTALNISLDTLNSDKFEKITRRKGWSRVMAAIDNAVQLGFNPVKVNCVIMRGVNDEEVVDFVALTKDKEIDVRFIEYMPFGGNKWNTDKLVPYKEMMHAIKNRYPNIQRLDSSNFITAKPFKVPSHKGQIGFISSISEPFCGSCNRIRLLADGSLKVCLLGSAEISLRDAIRNNCSEDDILAMISAALLRKKKQHAGLYESKIGSAYETTIIGPLNFPSFPLLSINRSTYLKSDRLLKSSSSPKLNYSTSSRLDNKKEEFSHVSSATGQLTMVDVGDKFETSRSATASATVVVGDRIAELIAQNSMKKGDVLSVARLAGICAAKKTSDLIPLCHNIALTFIDVKAVLNREAGLVHLKSVVRCNGKTGVEMEALTAVSVAALTVYDMCKAVSHNIRITDIRLLEKTGGKSGDYTAIEA